MNSRKEPSQHGFKAVLRLLPVCLLWMLQGQTSGTSSPAAFITFDVPGAQVTQPASLNSIGAITGNYLDTNDVFHGFLRKPDGAFVTFDAPAAGTGQYQGTVPRAINSSGVITGYYRDSNNVYHGFLRGPGGALITFDVPGAGTSQYQGTVPAAINSAAGSRGSMRSQAMRPTALYGGRVAR